MPRRSLREGGIVRAVSPGSLADRLGLRPADRILRIDDHRLRDVIDFRYHAAEDHFRLTLERDEGIREILVERQPCEELGTEFEEAVFDKVRTCNNDCLFCFLKGLAPGMRPSLYVKDDDLRLSFQHGNFVTLTNLTQRDWRRLEEQRLSPLNVSVHATDPALRREMLGNPRAPDILDQLRRLGKIGVQTNVQIVLCPGLNDGAQLERTVRELAALHPTVQSIGVVPVGMTRSAEERIAERYRRVTRPFTVAFARRLLRTVHRWQKEYRRRHGVGLVYAADEFYLSAGARIPSVAAYDGSPQYGNGIGMTRALIDDWRWTGRRLRSGAPLASAFPDVTVACGVLIAPTLREMAAQLAGLTGLNTRVVPVPSRFWGPRVTVSGLLTAQDIIAALGAEQGRGVVFLPRDSLDHAGERFLDGGIPQDVERALGRPVAFASRWSEVLRFLISPVK